MNCALEHFYRYVPITLNELVDSIDTRLNRHVITFVLVAELPQTRNLQRRPIRNRIEDLVFLQQVGRCATDRGMPAAEVRA